MPISIPSIDIIKKLKDYVPYDVQKDWDTWSSKITEKAVKTKNAEKKLKDLLKNTKKAKEKKWDTMFYINNFLGDKSELEPSKKKKEK